MPRTTPYDFRRKTELARAYLDDGALLSASRVLRELAVELDRAGHAKAEALRELVDGH